MSTLSDKVYAMPHIVFQRTILKNVEPTPEFQKVWKSGPNALTLEEKRHLAELILQNIDRSDVKLPLNNDDLLSFVIASTIRYAQHK